MKHISILFALISTILTSSCSINRVELLNDRLEQYNQAKRWSISQQIKSCIDPSKRGDVLKDMVSEIENEKVVDYSISDLVFDDKKSKAVSRIVYTYYANVDQDVKSKTEQLDWEYSSKKKSWFIVGRKTSK